MKIEATDIDSVSDTKSQTSNPPAALSNQIVAEVQTLESSI